MHAWERCFPTRRSPGWQPNWETQLHQDRTTVQGGPNPEAQEAKTHTPTTKWSLLRLGMGANAAVTNVTTPRGFALLKRARRGIEDPEQGGSGGDSISRPPEAESLLLTTRPNGPNKHRDAPRDTKRNKTAHKRQRKPKQKKIEFLWQNQNNLY